MPPKRSAHGEARPAVGVLAEDLQAAVAVASRLRQRGLAPVIVRDPSASVSGADAVVVDLDLHHAVSGSQAHTRTWIDWLQGQGCELIEVKLNAELRGSPEALVAGLAESEESLLLIVPAYPTAGRVCVDGHLLAPLPVGSGLDVDVRAATNSRDAQLIGLSTINQGTDAVVASVEAAVAAGTRRFIFDGTVEEHLRGAADAAKKLRDAGFDVVTASTGGWLRFHPDLGSDGFVVVVTPANHDTDRAQLKRVGAAYGSRALMTTAAEALTWADDTAHEVLASHRVVAVHETDKDDPDRWVISEGLARAVRGLLEASNRGPNHCLGIVASGGLTTTALVGELRGDGLRADLELEPLCPSATIVGGDYDGLRLLSKATGTGSEETLLRMTRQILGA